MLNRSIFLVLFSLLSLLSPLARADKLRAVLQESEVKESSKAFFAWTAEHRKTGWIKDIKAKHNMHGSHMSPGFVTNAKYLAKYIKDGNKPTIIDLRDNDAWHISRLRPSKNVPYNTKDLRSTLQAGKVPVELNPTDEDEYVVFLDEKNTHAPEIARWYAKAVKRLQDGADEVKMENKPAFWVKQDKERRKKWEHVKAVLLDGGIEDAYAWIHAHPGKGLSFEYGL